MPTDNEQSDPESSDRLPSEQGKLGPTSNSKTQLPFLSDDEGTMLLHPRNTKVYQTEKRVDQETLRDAV